MPRRRCQPHDISLKDLILAGLAFVTLAGSPALALVNPNGLLMLRYDADFDVARVRQDLVKVVH